MKIKNIVPFREEVIIQGKDRLFLIEVQGKLGTCFFIKDSSTNIYLCINYELISPEFIKSNGVIEINEKIKIIIDKKRKIFPYKKQCLFILMDINDNITEIDKYVFESEEDLNPMKFINENAYLFAFSSANSEKSCSYIPGKILNIDGYKIIHQFNTKKLLSVSPICVFNLL